MRDKTEVNYKRDKFDYLEIIRKCLGNNYIKNYDCMNGYNNNIFVINGEVVFKFPKDIINSSKIVLREFNILNSIKDKITTNIPVLNTYCYKDLHCSYYKIIKGVTYYELNKASKNNIINGLSKEIALFIKELHSIEYKTFIKRGSNLIDGFCVSKNFDLISRYFDNSFQQDDFKRTFDFINKFDFIESDYVLCHNDLNSKNIIITSNGTLSGIIDFGNSRIENYNVEFSIIAKEDWKLLFSLLNSYKKLTNKAINMDFIINYEKLRSYAMIGLLLSSNKKVDLKINKDLKFLYCLENKINNFL